MSAPQVPADERQGSQARGAAGVQTDGRRIQVRSFKELGGVRIDADGGRVHSEEEVDHDAVAHADNIRDARRIDAGPAAECRDRPVHGVHGQPLEPRRCAGILPYGPEPADDVVPEDGLRIPDGR